MPIVHAVDAKPLPIAYCQHMGHSIEINSENRPDCVFENTTRCDATLFYNGSCGQENVIDIAPRKMGEEVYVEFESCENGLVPSEPKYLLDQPICQKPSRFDLFEAIKNFFNLW